MRDKLNIPRYPVVLGKHVGVGLSKTVTCVVLGARRLLLNEGLLLSSQGLRYDTSPFPINMSKEDLCLI